MAACQFAALCGVYSTQYVITTSLDVLRVLQRNVEQHVYESIVPDIKGVLWHEHAIVSEIENEVLRPFFFAGIFRLKTLRFRCGRCRPMEIFGGCRYSCYLFVFVLRLFEVNSVRRTRATMGKFRDFVEIIWLPFRKSPRHCAP